MAYWKLHKKFQLSRAMGLRDFDFQGQPTLMGGKQLIVVHWLCVMPELYLKLASQLSFIQLIFYNTQV